MTGRPKAIYAMPAKTISRFVTERTRLSATLRAADVLYREPSLRNATSG